MIIIFVKVCLLNFAMKRFGFNFEALGKDDLKVTRDVVVIVNILSEKAMNKFLK